MIDNDVMNWLVPLFIGIIMGIAFIVGWLVKNEVDKSSLQKDVLTLKDEMKERHEHNIKQHEELYSSRNDMREVLVELSALFKYVKEKIDIMDAKIDKLPNRRQVDRGG
jgi:hypothetical protein